MQEVAFPQNAVDLDLANLRMGTMSGRSLDQCLHYLPAGPDAAGDGPRIQPGLLVSYVVNQIDLRHWNVFARRPGSADWPFLMVYNDPPQGAYADRDPGITF